MPVSPISAANAALCTRTVAEKKKDSKEAYATRDDVEQAIEALSSSDELRLEKFARFRIRGLGRRAMGRDHEDLLCEAIKSIWIGAEDPNEGRRWRKDAVTFVQQVLGAVRSIASHWKDGADEGEAWLDCELEVETESGEAMRPIENAPSDAPNQERVLRAKERLAAIYHFFRNDDDAALVLEGIREGWSGPEITERLAIPKLRYEAALKKIRYHVK